METKHEGSSSLRAWMALLTPPASSATTRAWPAPSHTPQALEPRAELSVSEVQQLCHVITDSCPAGGADSQKFRSTSFAHFAMAKGSSSTKPPPPAPNPMLEQYKSLLIKGRPTLCTPVVDKAGKWSWRGKVLELVWDAIVQEADAFTKVVDREAEHGGFVERYEATAGDTLVVAGTCRNKVGNIVDDEAHQVGFAIVFSPGKAGDKAAVQAVHELPLPLAFIAVHLLSTMQRLFFTRDKVLELLTSTAVRARGDVLECISWMRERLAAVDRSPGSILTRCAELTNTAKEMHSHYLKQVQARKVDAAETAVATAAEEKASSEADAAVPTETATAIEESAEATPAQIELAVAADAPDDDVDEDGEEEDDEEVDEDEDEEEKEEEVGLEDEGDDEDEATWPSSARLSVYHRELAQEKERFRVAKLNFERAERMLELAKAKVASAEDDVHDERVRRHARAERRAEKSASKARKDAAAAVAEKKAAVEEKGTAPKAGLKKGFLSAGLGESPSEKRGVSREADEIAELKCIAEQAPQPVSALLSKLRGLATKAVTTEQATKRMHLDPVNFLAHCDAVVECAPPSPGSSMASFVHDRWFVAVGSSKCVPPAPPVAAQTSDDEDEEDLDDIDGDEPAVVDATEEAPADKEVQPEPEPEQERDEESVALCIAQKEDGTIYGAIGWDELGALPRDVSGLLNRAKPLPPPTRCVRLDDSSWDGDVRFMHMTVQGLGDACSPIVPCGYTLSGSALYHFAAGVQHFWLAKTQVNARLSQGKADQAEVDHVEMLMDAANDRFAAVAREVSADRWLPPDFSRCESAVQGLRKTLLKRPWNPRCASCGVRHEDIEYSTCRFWQAWVV